MNVNNDKPIGIFDSGIGGLTVVAEVMKEMPYENIVYFGDTARVPYGSKSKETVTKFSKQIVRYLLTMGVKAVIVACNTASSNCYGALVKEFDIPIFEMVNYGASGCVKATKNKRVGVIGTEATIRSGAYERAIKCFDDTITVYSKACPLFVPLAEGGWTDNTVANITADMYLQEFTDREIDTLILGCTHYPLLYNCIRRSAGGVKIVNPAVNAASGIYSFFKERNMLKTSKCKAARHFFVSDNSAKFSRMAQLVLNEVYESQKIDIENY